VTLQYQSQTWRASRLQRRPTALAENGRWFGGPCGAAGLRGKLTRPATAAGGYTALASNTGPSTQTRFIARPASVTTGKAHPAQPPTAQAHELLERHLAGHAEAARHACGGLQHRCRAAGEHLDSSERLLVERRQPRGGEVGDVTVEAAGKIPRASRAGSARPSHRAAACRRSRPRDPGHDDRGRPRLERKRDLRAHQHQRSPVRVGAGLERFGEEHHRRDAHAAADQQA